MPIEKTTLSASAYQKSFGTAEKDGGLFDLSDWGVVEISGPDATDFLNRMSTLGFKAWNKTDVVWGAFLTGKGHVVSLGQFQKIDEQTYHFIVPPKQANRTAEHLEMFHFAEKLTITDVSSTWKMIALKAPYEFSGATWKDALRKDLYWIKRPGTEALAIPGAAPLPRKLFEYYRVRAAIPEVGKEINDEIILETGFDIAVSRNKGCYPGQEVVERIFTYGSVNKKLRLLKWHADETIDLDQKDEILKDGKLVVDVVTRIDHPTSSNGEGSGYALAYVAKNLWDFKDVWVSKQNVHYRLIES